ncbi:MAG: hypothetical protein HUU20_13545 [Pirellulales bacterium]|nr:hypothetical protein [Pirellulales bacterium]
MSEPKRVHRRNFLSTSLAAAGAGAVIGAAADDLHVAPESGKPAGPQPAESDAGPMPCGKIGNVSISRLLLGGNLISGFMHARDLKYVEPLFRAYVTEEKILQTLKIAEEHGINTVFETGAPFVERYNREYGGHMQFIPHIQPELDGDWGKFEDDVKHKVDTGAVAVYVWGVAGDKLVQAGAVDRLAKAVEFAKTLNVPVGVGGHSLLVPMACEKHGIPCDFYVKTLHSDQYPSATPKPLRKEFIWIGGGEGWYDNMWCINPEETVEFMKTVAKPWLAFKVLAAGAFHPRQGFAHAFKSGADFIAVGMFDFQVRENSELVARLVRREAGRERPWRA